jgi:hypothetical protein
MYCVYLFMNFNKMILIAEHPLMADKSAMPTINWGLRSSPTSP